MARIEVFPHVMVKPPSNSSSSSDHADDGGEEDSVWIHWKDPYWSDVDSRTPHPDPTTTPLPPQANGTHLLNANRELTLHLVPFLVILAVVLCLTLLGNGLICYVYRTRLRHSDHFFVVLLAGMEMAFICLGVPMEMAVLALPLLFDLGAACKVFRYLQTASVCVVLLTLAVIALDRYCKLTRPNNALSQAWAVRLTAGAVVLGLCLAIPAPWVFGSKAVPTDLLNLSGVTCGVEDADRYSAAHIVYIALLLLTFLLTLAVLTVLYVIMLVRISRRKSAARGERASPKRRRFPQTHRFGVSEDSSSSYGADDTRPLPTSSSGTSFGTAAPSTPKSGRMSPSLDPARVPLKGGKEAGRGGQRYAPSMDTQGTQMTLIFFRVTLWTVVALTPFVVFRTLQVLTDTLEGVQPTLATVMYQVGAHLYLLHPPVLPIIHLLCNDPFHREVRMMLRTLGAACKRRTHSHDSGACSA